MTPSGEDVDGDGLADLVCSFDTAATGLGPQHSSAVLKGRLVTGEPFLGRDDVVVSGASQSGSPGVPVASTDEAGIGLRARALT
jgi:hypothetical protein